MNFLFLKLKFKIQAKKDDERKTSIKWLCELRLSEYYECMLKYIWDENVLTIHEQIFPFPA